ncbi:MAG: VOC family protein [Candidatus Micrarchaeota archaeon]|nr:VOC family protein [Candidatus Micrarchaeota archaeon]
MPRAVKVPAVPQGFHTVTPYLSVNGGIKAINFYKKAFGAKEITKWRSQTPDGKVIHSRLRIGDSLVMVSDRFGPNRGDSKAQSPVTLHIYSKDVDKLWKNALAAGAKVEMPLDDMFWGERYGQLRDPLGHRWSVSTLIRMSKEEMEAKRKKAMAMFGQGKQHK